MKPIEFFIIRSSKKYLPRTEEELRKTVTDYERMGLPGALGSTDCVHVKWERCPGALANVFTGKEGYPTLAWQCTVNHKMRFMSVSNVFFMELLVIKQFASTTHSQEPSIKKPYMQMTISF